MTVPQGRRFRNYPARAGGFIDWQTGRGVTGAGVELRAIRRPAIGRLVEAAAAAGVEQLTLCGKLPGVGRAKLREWAYGMAGAGRRDLPGGWAHGRHYWPDTGAPVLRYQGPEGRALEVHLAESWFGDQEVTPEAARAALALLAADLAERARGCPRLGTPVQTGLAAMDRLCDADRALWPDDVRDLIRATSPQHRMEWTAAGVELRQVVEVDMRLAYGALCWGLGAGPLEVFAGFDGARRARYHGYATVPAGWDRPGLLPLRDERGLAWHYPAEPGRRFFFYADGAEVNVAIRQGWELGDLVGMAPADSAAKPLDRWARELVGMAEIYRACGETFAYRAARSVLLQGVGGLVGRPGRIFGVLPFHRAEEVPAAAIPATVRRLGDVITWAEEVPPARGDLEHPEWAAAIWGRCRARLLWKSDGSGTLHHPPGIVAGYRGDAVYLTDIPAGWPLTAKAGGWQEKARHSGPFTFAGLPAFDRYKQRSRDLERV